MTSSMSLAVVLRSYAYVAYNRHCDEFASQTSKSGVITIPLNEFLSHGGIVDEPLIMLYDEYIKKSAETTAFRDLVNFSSRSYPRGIRRPYVFDITVEDIEKKLLVPTLPPTFETPLLTKRSRVSKKLEYSPSTVDRYAREAADPFWELINEKYPSEVLRRQIMREVIQRLLTLNDDANDEYVMNAKIVSNFKSLVENMKLHGRNDREQVHFMDNLALAITGGDIPLLQLGASTGLSRRVLLRSRIIRKKFDDESTKAEEEASQTVNDGADSDVDLGDEQIEISDTSDIDSVSSTDSVSSPTIQPKRQRRSKGQKAKENLNRFKFCYAYIDRKKRTDMILGDEVQRFCHESQWGGRVDTLKLNKEQAIIPQPLGGFEYETIRSFQYSIKEMYAYFIDSEYGVRQRALNKERDLSLRRFRELICPCMTTAKQRDTADEIVAEFKFCLLTWDIGMRKKDRNVRAEIEKCQCILHKKGSSTCESYTMASRSPSQFLAYLLCPKIQRDELAVQVGGEQSTYEEKVATIKAENIAAAISELNKQDAIKRESGGRKGNKCYDE